MKPSHDQLDPASNGGKFLTSHQHRLLQKYLQPDLKKTYRQRLQIMLMADQGKSQAEICRTLGCCPATARHWIDVARKGEIHCWQQNPPGRPKVASEEYLQRLRELATKAPKEYGYPFKRWTASWLSQHLEKEFGVRLSERHVNRLLQQMGLSTRNQTPNCQGRKS